MKIAVISDIHSNVFALEEALKDIRKKKPALIINLGDTLYGPIKPRETYELIRNEDIITISGNQDRILPEANEEQVSANPVLDYVIRDIGEGGLRWLSGLAFEYIFEGEMYACHGTPKNDEMYLLENVESGYPLIKSDAEIIAALGGSGEKVILCGHSHLPGIAELSTGQIVVNPGSIGLPAYSDDNPPHKMETFSPMLSYAMIEKRSGSWKVEFIRLPYDHKKAATEARKNGRDDWAQNLETGRG